MATIITKRESERGCGFRKGGGIYLVNDGAGRSCGRMPLPLHVCPTCSQGIKPARGWTWINGKAILETAPPCKFHVETREYDEVERVTEAGTEKFRIPGRLQVLPAPECTDCPMSTQREVGRVGLMWVGGKFYPTPESFVQEAQRMGLSKRIAQIPKELVVGETWVWLAHREVFPATHTEECLLTRLEADYEFRVEMEKADHPKECDCGAKPQPGVFHAFVPTRIEYVINGDETEAELDALEKRGLTLVKVERIGENGELFPDTPPTKDDDDGN